MEKKVEATSGGWLSGRAKSPEFRKSFEKHGVAEDFIGALENVMEQQRVTRSQLAERMGCKPANITRAMRYTTNLTISTMVEMAFAVNYRVRIWLQPLSATEGVSTNYDDFMKYIAGWSKCPPVAPAQPDSDTEAASAGGSTSGALIARAIEVGSPTISGFLRPLWN